MNVISAMLPKNWLATKELELRHCSKEALFFAMYSYSGNLIEVPQ